MKRVKSLTKGRKNEKNDNTYPVVGELNFDKAQKSNGRLMDKSGSLWHVLIALWFPNCRVCEAVAKPKEPNA